MQAVRAGDAGELGRLFERYHLPLYEFLYRTTGDRHGAEDLVQDVFVRILKYRHTYRDGSPFVTWMYRIARNARADHFRRRHGSGVIDPLHVDEHELRSPAPIPSEAMTRDADAALLRQALMQLPDDKRELLVLARYQQLPYDQIATLLDIEVGAVKVRVHRALKQLRERFDDLTTRRTPWTAKTPSPLSGRY
jgi:RNA polymerase sigma factor (sigma-70 family)